MKQRTLLFCVAALAAASAGCSTQQWYSGVQAGARSACQRYPEPDRSKCLGSNDMDYDRYRRERDDMLLK
jgi:type IV secretory pathway TraG/TraD family ATPase VirD4